MYRTTHQPTVSRLAAATVTTALLASLCSPFAALASAEAGPDTDHSKNVTTSEVAQALDHTSGILESSATISMSSDADSALKTDDGAVNIPKDAASGVTLSSQGGPSLDITLPNADQAGDGQQVAPGVVAYSSNNGSANAVQAQDDGSVRMLTVIDNKSAPRTYDYKITIPDGGRIELAPDGSAVVVDTDTQIIAHVDSPWAKDANGKSVRTWFTTDGVRLIQHIRHNVRNIAYPVTADPSISFGWNAYVNFSKSETDTFKKYQEAGSLVAVMPGVVCSKIPHWGVQAACDILVAAKASQLNWAVRNASDSGSCLQLAVPYIAVTNPSLASIYSWFGWRKC